MADTGMAQNSLAADAAIRRRPTIEPSVRDALPYFAPIAVFPLMACAAHFGGWWLAGPFVFALMADQFDTVFGEDVENMNPTQSDDRRMELYKIAVWCWVALYPITFLFAFRQIFVAEHLALWEDVLIVLALGTMARMTLNAGHDMMHRRVLFERRIGEFLMASVSFAQEVTEHIYVHHAHIGTPKDALTPPKGLSFWRYLPFSVGRSYLDAWRFERDRMARRHLPVWHHTNPIWRYVLETAAWYALAYWIGGPWAIPVLAIICACGILQLRMADYIQHYGLQRIRLPNGRFEPVRPRHSWTAAYRLSNWLYYNAQRHADHHISATRLYPLLQHCGEEESPQLPGSYSAMGSLIMFPRQWFRKMDPLVDEWRARFYPEITDWSTYDSAAYRARPDAFDAIAEIHSTSPFLTAWMNRKPELLDGLLSREFTDLDLPAGFGPDPEFEAMARGGLARVYWTHELDVPAMLERISDIPAQGVREAVETTRIWSNDKVFQIGMHTIRGNLSPTEAGAALSNVAEATIAAVLSSADDGFIGRRGGGVAALLLGDAAGGGGAPGTELDVMFVHDGGSSERIDALCRNFRRALRALSRDNLLFAEIPDGSAARAVRSLAELSEFHGSPASAGELLDLTKVRCVHTCGDASVGERFEDMRLEILASSVARQGLIAELREAQNGGTEPGLLAVQDVRGGFRDVERAARYLQLTHAAAAPGIHAADAVSVFRTAGECDLISAEKAERLSGAAVMWRNLHGILRLVAADGFSTESASPEAGAAVARACGARDLSSLTGMIRDTATQAASDIDELVG